MKTVIHVWTHEFNINHEHLLKYNYYNEKHDSIIIQSSTDITENIKNNFYDVIMILDYHRTHGLLFLESKNGCVSIDNYPKNKIIGFYGADNLINVSHYKQLPITIFAREIP